MKKQFKSSKKLLFEMVEKINQIKPNLNEDYVLMGSYKGRPAEELDTAADEQEAEYLKGEYQKAYGRDFSVWIERDGQKISEQDGVKYRAEVTGTRENVWSTNAMEYDTEEEAKEWLEGLAGRWFGFDMSRVVPTSVPKGQAVDMENDVIFQNFRR